MRRLFRVAAILVGGWLSAGPLPAAQAHHGWGHYETGMPVIFEAIVVEVRWRNPHPDMVVEVTASTPAPLPNVLPIPPELRSLGIQDVLDAARPSPVMRWTLDLAPINRLQRWGLPRVPAVGDRIQGLGFPSCRTEGLMRPNIVVIDGVPVRQQSVSLPDGCSSSSRGDWLNRLFDG